MSLYTLSDAAKQDIDDLWDYIASDNPDAADRMVDRLSKKFVRVARTPSAFAVHPEIGYPVRFSIVKPFVLFFIATEGKVEIIRVIHGHRDIPDQFEMNS